MGGEELKWYQLAPHHLMSQQGPILVHAVKLKPIITAQISGKLVTSGIKCSDCFSILRENPSEEDDHDN